MSDVTIFGDDEPEDSWHPDDRIDLLIDNLRRRALLLLDVIDAGREFTVRDRVRLADLVDDLDLIHRRLTS